MTVLLRPANPDEHFEMSALAVRSKAYWGYDEAFMSACVDELTVTPERIRTMHYLVAEKGGHLIGMAGLAPDGDGWEVSNMFVHPDHIGTGLGGRLFRALMKMARDLDISELGIDADPNARPFYERFGAVFRHMTPSGSIGGRDIPHLRLKL